jgi:sugar phosphate isomerase/epimerase
MIAWVASRGFRWIQLDAALAGIRPRELDRSARRDLAALLKRTGLSLSGVDLWIPPPHFASAAHADRAAEAVLNACTLVAELARLTDASSRVVAVELPDAALPGIEESLAAGALREGVAIADHRWPREARGSGGAIGAGIDPASLIAAGADPAMEVARLAQPPIQARLSDLSGAGRVVAGAGRLDLAAYEAALLTRGLATPLVVDVRGLAARDLSGLAPRPD